jgi:cytochrome b561
MTGDPLRYDRVAAGLHWLTAALVIALIVLGIGAEPMEKSWGVSALATLTVHKSLGMTVFVLTLLRLAWRLGHHPPPLPETTPRWQRASAHVAHFALYAFLLVLPVLGYLLSSGGPFPLQWFGLFDMPKAPVTKSLADAAHAAHVAGGITVAVLVVVHIAAALWHQLVQRDRLLARMRIG